MTNKKVFIEDGLSLYNKTGIGQYTLNIEELLKELGYDVIMPRKYFLEKIKNASSKRILYVLWLNLIFPFWVTLSGCRNVLFTNFLTPVYKIPSIKYYPVIHDLWAIKFPETMSKTKRNYQTWILKIVKNNYYRIITVSETVKQEIIDYFQCDRNEVKVIYNYFSFGENPKIDLADNEQISVLNKFDINNKEYILSVGSLNKRKNIQMLIDAYNNIKTNKKLVIVGKAENTDFNKHNNNIIFTGYLKDEELKILYKNALLFVFPSIYEGFGIPLIDAQGFGIPVLCSDIPIFHEIGEDSVEYSQLDKEIFAAKISDIINNHQQLENFIKLGQKNKTRFSKNVLKNNINEALS